jgi:hypothetical protein
MADGWCPSFSHEANDAYIYYHLDIQFDGAMDDVPVDGVIYLLLAAGMAYGGSWLLCRWKRHVYF